MNEALFNSKLPIDHDLSKCGAIFIWEDRQELSVEHFALLLVSKFGGLPQIPPPINPHCIYFTRQVYQVVMSAMNFWSSYISIWLDNRLMLATTRREPTKRELRLGCPEMSHMSRISRN